MMTPHQNALSNLLLSSFPNFQSGDPESALAAYELVMAQHDERDLQPGIMILINGEYQGHDGRFAPTAPQLATALRMARDKRLESERRSMLRIAPPPEPEIDPAERARVAAGLKQLAVNLGSQLRTDDAEAAKKRKAMLDKTNERFAPDMSDEAVRGRLLPQRDKWTAGDPEGERDVA